MSNLKSYRVRILNHHEQVKIHIVTSFKFEEQARWQDLPGKEVPEGELPLFICKCGSREFTENGRDINEYECPCCGQFVELIVH